MKPHWYKITIYECPVCGNGETYRERQYTPKPKDPKDRYEYYQFGCAGGTCWSLC